MAENTRLRDKNDKNDDLYEFWRQNYVKNDSCFLQETNKTNKITLYWKLVYLCWWKERQKYCTEDTNSEASQTYRQSTDVSKWIRKMDQKNRHGKSTCTRGPGNVYQ